MPTSSEILDYLDRVTRQIDRVRFPTFEPDEPSTEQLESEMVAIQREGQQLASSIRMSQEYSRERVSSRVAVTEFTPSAGSVEPTIARAIDNSLHQICGLPEGWTGLM